MATAEKYVLDLSGLGIKKLDKRDGIGIKHLILDNNELSKLENLECFPDLEKLSVTGNTLVRMYGVSKCRRLTYLNLSNNSIVCIEGLKDMTLLSVLNLSVNSIKSIQNLQFCENLSHLDLSKNDIVSLANISSLTKLKTLHLNGNKICSLNYASKYLPVCLAQLSLADNAIADLNEISHLHGLEALEQLTIEGNPCVQMNGDIYRPFVINWCLGLRLLDGYVASHKESLKAEWLYSQGKGRHFCIGEHSQLIEYLALQCPLSADKDVEEEDEKLSRILHMQRQHKEQFLNEQAQTTHQEHPNLAKRKVISKMSQSYHSSEPTQTKAPELRTTTITPSKVMYESAPDVLFHTANNELATAPPSSVLSEGTGQTLSKSEQLHNSARSPITIEQVAVDIDANKTKPAYKPPTPHQHYEERRLRPSSVSDSNTTIHPKGNVIRKVSKRATSPSVSTPSPGRAKVPGSFRSKLSPSRSCIISSKLSLSKTSSESDTSEELSQLSGKGGGPSNIRRGPRSQSQTCSPVYRQKFQTSSMKGTPDFENNKIDSRFPVQTSQPYIIQTSLSQMLATQFGHSEEKLNKAAIKIQAVWRGYHTRHCSQQVYKLRQEIRFRRMEDHIHHLHSHMCRLTDFVLRQQKDLLHERELRKMQAEDIRSLHEKAKDLQKDVAQILKAKQTESPKVSEPDSYDIPSSSFGRKCILKDNKYFTGFENIKSLQDVTPDTPSSSLQYSTQAFQENSGLFSPSSQTSSVTSAGPDGTFSSMQNRHILQPSTSDLSDADSGLQSMVSPNLSTFIELERHICGEDVSNTVASGSCATQQLNHPPSHFKKPLGKFSTDNHETLMPSMETGASDVIRLQHEKKNEVDDQNSVGSTRNHDTRNHDESSNCSSSMNQQSSNMDGSYSSSHCSDSSLGNQPSMSSSKYIESNSSSCTTVASVLSNHAQSLGSESDSKPTKVDASLSPIFPCPPSQISNDLPKSETPVTTSSNPNGTFPKSVLLTDQKSKEERDVYDYQSQYSLKTACDGKNFHCNAPTTSSSSYANSIPSSFTIDDIPELDRNQISNASKIRPSILTKSLIHGSLSNSSTPLEDGNSPQSPCTVEMSGRISHSCSFQSDGFTAAEELSATTTVKLFSARTMSMACGSTPVSPQTTIQRPLSLSEPPLSQQSICSPLVLASNVWEKKVQDIDSTFQRLQAQIRDLEGSVGQVGQLGQFWYPALLSEDPKEPRHLIHYMEPNSGALMLDMPKVNFKCSNNGNSDFLLQTHFARHAANGVPFLPPTGSQLVKPAQNSDFCSIEELDAETQNMSERAKYLKLPLHEKTSNESQGKQ